MMALSTMKRVLDQYNTEIMGTPAGRAYALRDWVRDVDAAHARLPKWHRLRRRLNRAVNVAEREMHRRDPAAWLVYLYAGIWDFVDDGTLTTVMYGYTRVGAALRPRIDAVATARLVTAPGGRLHAP